MEKCCLASHIAEECVLAAPKLVREVEESFLGSIRSGDLMVLAQLEAVLQTKDEKFVPRDIPALAHIINSASLSDTACVSALEDKLRSVQIGIDQDQWALFRKELVEFDMPAVRIYYNNVLTHQKALDARMSINGNQKS